MKCRSCNSSDKIRNFVDLGTSPASNSYLIKNQLDKAEMYYPLKVVVCQNCWLVQTQDFVKREELFSPEYDYHSSFSRSFLEHAKNYVDMITNRFSLNQKFFVIEVASNDGYLLQYFKKRGIDHIGIEPTLSSAKISEEKGIKTINKFFGQRLAKELRDKGFIADLMIANNVLAHVPDINDFLKGFRTLIKHDGIITFEFPHLVNLVENNQFDTIYHEHFSYISLSALSFLLKNNKLEAFDVEEISVHGGSLRVFCQKIGGPKKRSHNLENLLNKETDLGLNSISYYEEFQDKAIKIKDEFQKFLINNRNKKIVGYGAAAKGNTLMNYAGIKSDNIEYIVDRNPSKIDKFTPGSRIPIVSEDLILETKPDFIIVFPWNLIDEIKSQLSYVKQWNCKLVTFIPNTQIYG